MTQTLTPTRLGNNLIEAGHRSAAWSFRAVLREGPDITIKLLAVLSQRLRQAEVRQI